MTLPCRNVSAILRVNPVDDLEKVYVARAKFSFHILTIPSLLSILRLLIQLLTMKDCK